MGRKKEAQLTAVVYAGHRVFTGFNEAARVEDCRHLRIVVPELPWLDYVDIDLGEGTVDVKVTPAAEDRALPRLTCTQDGEVKLRV